MTDEMQKKLNEAMRAMADNLKLRSDRKVWASDDVKRGDIIKEDGNVVKVCFHG